MRLPKFLLRYQFGLTNRPSRFYDELVARYLKALDGRAALAPKIFTPKPIGSEVRQQQTIQFNRLIDRLMKLVRKWDEDDFGSLRHSTSINGKVNLPGNFILYNLSCTASQKTSWCYYKKKNEST